MFISYNLLLNCNFLFFIVPCFEKQKGIKVDKRKVELEMPLRNVGRAEVKIKTYQGVIGKLTVIIKGEA